MAMAPEQTGIGIRRHFTTEGVHPYDEVAYVRFASVYKGFDGPGDFEREVLALSQPEPAPPPPPPVD